MQDILTKKELLHGLLCKVSRFYVLNENYFKLLMQFFLASAIFDNLDIMLFELQHVCPTTLEYLKTYDIKTMVCYPAFLL